jgi:hypothetical protein
MKEKKRKEENQEEGQRYGYTQYDNGDFPIQVISFIFTRLIDERHITKE